MRRYMQDPAFAKAYRDGRRAMLEERVSALQQASQAALETLRTALDDEDANVRVRAARAIFDYAFKGLETERRIREVEELARDIEELKRELA
jgi:HEAT repeat protein